jgi:hypothetical protein
MSLQNFLAQKLCGTAQPAATARARSIIDPNDPLPNAEENEDRVPVAAETELDDFVVDVAGMLGDEVIFQALEEYYAGQRARTERDMNVDAIRVYPPDPPETLIDGFYTVRFTNYSGAYQRIFVLVS